VRYDTPLQPEDLRRLGPYELLGRLGEGGMGVVYLGRDHRGEVAIKRIKEEYADRHRAMRRLRRELDAARRVPRYCTAQIYGYDFTHDPPYIVSEYIKGPTLKAVVNAEGPLDDSNLHSLAIAVVGALKEIHLAGVVHGDLTPRNVLLSLHGPRVIDFGIARVPEQTVSSSIEIAGTPAYMAPEHFTNGPVTSAADVFAWGSVMAFAGTGRPPFGEGSLAQLSDRIRHEAPDLVGLDPVVRPLVEAAMQKRPQDRPDADWLLEELKRSARAAHVGPPRIRDVDKVLESATLGVDRPSGPTDGNRPPAQRSGSGFGPIPLGIALAMLSLLLALGVWFHTFGVPGSIANLMARSLFGYGAFFMPLLGLGWAAVALQHPRDATLWPAGREALEGLFWQPKSVRGWLRLVWSLARAMRSAVIGGPVLLFLGIVILLHRARGAPPITATNFEREQSGGLLGAIVVRSFQGARLGWLTLPLALLLLLGGTAVTAWAVRRRWGTWPAGVLAVACVVALLGHALYLRDHNYRYWAKLDPATGRIAAFRGLTKEYGSSWIFKLCLTWANARASAKCGFDWIVGCRCRPEAGCGAGTDSGDHVAVDTHDQPGSPCLPPHHPPFLASPIAWTRPSRSDQASAGACSTTSPSSPTRGSDAADGTR
jgi:predicted Ser/Thr protein kinase